MKIVVTGSAGLLGWHASARLHARNCAARFKKETEPFALVTLGHNEFDDSEQLTTALTDASVILHFAGVNRGSDDYVETENPAIAERLVSGCRAAGTVPHIIYANSTQADSNTPYGRSKYRASEILKAFAPRFTDLILPHIFGECARPYYNNVTATFIDQLIQSEEPSINPNGSVQLLHAGAAVEVAIQAAVSGKTGQLRPSGQAMPISALWDRLHAFKQDYDQNLYPDLGNDFDLALFNTFRAALYPACFPRTLKLNTDARGTLFEAIKGGGGGQTFLSWTKPGITRGDHFHLKKVERFLVLEGEAIIRIRRALHEQVWSYPVSGEHPSFVDMPTLHTHSIENIGNRPLLTLFWAHEIFDPSAPDTYADSVLSS